LEQSTNPVPHVEVKLGDIPEIVFHESTAYVLREVLNYHKGKPQLRNSIGHFTTYCERQGGSWEL